MHQESRIQAEFDDVLREAISLRKDLEAEMLRCRAKQVRVPILRLCIAATPHMLLCLYDVRSNCQLQVLVLLLCSCGSRIPVHS